ncbi:hypothetical protein JNB71_03455 [Rhizobium herbae]|uniref:Tip attachment protein J domain-containing protein n=1 Tax=Rhizobium herbae TaxID=508661 RepID=A0ABS7H7X6_9HYPH|nr:phage tail protein [Rhizobium herbae]MBW9062368.1 hypothetical protein [Rhizobium herbae]
MKLFVLFLNVAWWVLASAEPAHAGPVIAAIGAIIAKGGILGFLVKTALSAALSFASSLIQKALQKKQKQAPQGVKLDVELGDDLPVSTVIGRYATAGKRKYIGTFGELENTPNAFLADVIEVGNIPCGDITTLGLWIGDQKCTILLDKVNAVRGYPIKEFLKDPDNENSDPFAWIKFKDGTQTVADPYLVAMFGDDEDRPWTEDMIGRGCPYAIMTYRFNQKYFGNGVPACIFEPGPPKLYDIRKDSTNGGSGSHRWNNPSTWEPSYNLAVMIYNVIRGMYYGDEWFFGGQNLHASRLPASSWIAAAQEAARLIEVTGQPSEPQFRGGYEITGDMEPLDVIDDLRAGCNGRLAEVGGSFKLQLGAFGAATFFFTDADIIVTKGQSFQPFPGLDETFNAIEATFPDPAEKWASKDAPRLGAKTLIDPATGKTLFEIDGNRELPVSGLQFTAVPYKRQVQRLMRAMIKEERRFRTHQFYLPPDAWVLEPNDVVAWSSERNGYTNKKFLVLAIEGEMTMNQLVTIREIDPTDYDWSSDFELPTSEGWVGRIYAPIQPMQGWSVSATTINDSTGLARRPAIRVSCAANLDNVRNVLVFVRNKATGDVVFSSEATPYDAPYAWTLSGNWCLPATEYEVAGKLVPLRWRETALSAWLSVTTPDVRFSVADLHLLEVTEAVKADIVQLSEWIWQDNNIRQLIDDSKALARSIAEQDLANFADKQQLRREIATTTGEFASYIEQITVASSTTAALASQVTQLTAGLAGKADVSTLNSTVAQVSAQGDLITAHGASINAINASLNDKATVSALNALSGTVTSQGNTITAQGTSISSLSAQVGEATADARLRFEVVNTGISGYSKVGLQARFGTAEDYRTAGFYAYVPSDPGQLPRVVVNAGRFAVAAGDDELGSQIFAVDGSGVYIDTAYIRNISTSKITFEDGSVQTSALAQGAATKLFDVASIDNVTMTTVFQGVADTNVSKTVNDGIVINADIIARATTLVGGKASLLIELREDNVMIKESTLEFNALGASQTATFYHMRTAGAGVFNYKIVVKKSAAGEDFFIGRRTIAPVVYKKAN